MDESLSTSKIERICHKHEGQKSCKNGCLKFSLLRVYCLPCNKILSSWGTRSLGITLREFLVSTVEYILIYCIFDVKTFPGSEKCYNRKYIAIHSGKHLDTIWGVTGIVQICIWANLYDFQANECFGLIMEETSDISGTE